MATIPTLKQSTVTVNNISHGETVYQRCVLLIGQCTSTGSDEDFLSVSISDANSKSFPDQNWPISEGQFKSLVILSPGTNFITLRHNGQATGLAQLALTYIPLLQTPPLHLAIMIAKDSPLLIDCPPLKRGAISSAHCDLEAAIKKFRMTAYMWQALTAEDMRAKGLGRRSFRLEEEWTSETLSREFLQASLECSGNHMRSTAKIHLIMSEKTVAEIRDAQVAQQNPQACRKDDIFNYFNAALKAHGDPFVSSAYPVVAGLILDSTYSPEQNMILGHAALGCSNPSGISLGMMGSHLTYSWPRFLEEVSACLLDTSIPGDTVGNDNGECASAWETCAVGQGAFLHEVGHAFGAPHTSGIMARGYSQHWPKNFLSKTAFCRHKNTGGITVIDGETLNEARWDLSDALSFKNLRHFWLPTDILQSQEILAADLSIQVVYEDQNDDFLRLVISCPAGIARIKLGDIAAEREPTTATPVSKLQFTMDELESRFDRSKPLAIDVLAMNGKSRVVGNVWKLFSNVSFIRVPGTSITLQKRSIISKRLQGAKDDDTKNIWDWAVLLNEKGKDGKLTRATTIDCRVGCILDGGVVYFEDGHTTPCGPRWRPDGHNHHFGGHASQKITLPEGVDIVKVELTGDHELNGLRFHLSNGTSGGHIYMSKSTGVLEPAENEKIIGFYGRSDWGRSFDGITEFGIITAPKDVVLPDIIYDLPELQNTDGGNGPKETKRKRYDSDGDDHSEDDEDEDLGY